jgi:RNA polymerase sigma-70 factor (ECF subfamily)
VVEGRPQDERELVRRAVRGDEYAFAELVGAHEETAFRLAYLITGNAVEAEDACQEAIVKAWRALGRFRTSRPLRPWLLRIVANEARNRRRAAGRRAGLAASAAFGRHSGDAAPSPEELAVAADESRRLLEELAQLPDQARLVLSCRFLLGLSERETAAALGVRPGTVKSRTARALAALRELHV